MKELSAVLECAETILKDGRTLHTLQLLANNPTSPHPPPIERKSRIEMQTTLVTGILMPD